MLEFERRNAYFDRLTAQSGLRWLGQNTNHLPPPPAVTAAMQQVIASGEFQGYAPPAGYERLRELVVADLGLAESRAESDDRRAAAWITDGAVAGLYHTVCTLLGPGDEMIAPDPGWKWPLAFARSRGASVTEVPIWSADGGYRLAPAALERAISSRTRLIYLVDPNNPTGACATAQEIREICDIARAAGAWLIHDCTYRHFADAHTLAWRHYPERTVMTYSFSKWLGLAGMRVGAIVASASVLERLAEAPPNNLGSSVMAQRAAIAGLEVKDQWFPEVQRAQRANQAAIAAAVASVPGMSIAVYPSQGNFMAIDVSGTGVSPDALVAAYQGEGILIRQGGYHTRRFADCFVKVSTTVPAQWVAEFCERLPAMVEQARAAPPAAGLY